MWHRVTVNLPSESAPELEEGGAGQHPAATDAIDRRTLDAVFGDVLPDTTADERDDHRRSLSTDEWYRENRPPHHDR
jgi:hypothetical protein